ncbi:MAG: efflux RND transporter periplasmic adaptor subunit [Acidobacteria bacterium]|nr:efflux RND transporter periplasmic adaptor subunit [Acidobacteriota bacterium]
MSLKSALSATFRGSRRWYFLSALALIGAGWLWFGSGNGAETDNYLTATSDRGVIRNSVAATGTIQAVLTVQVGSQVSGRIATLSADFNSVVRKGQVLATIDPANFDAQLEQVRADLNNTRAGVGTAQAQVSTQQADLAAAKVAARDAGAALTRANELKSDGIVSTRDLEIAQATFDQATARVEQAQAQVQASLAALEQSKARVEQSRASVRLAEVNRVYTVITSPVDGVVISRSVDVGQTVAASLSAPVLFSIANDLTKMQVVANVDEADIGSITGDSRVGFTVDAFPGEMFSGALNQIRLNPQTQQNVVTYSVIIDFPNPELKLRPGMTANTTFTIAERADALRIPNSSLRFWPDDVPREKEREMLAKAAGEPAPPAAVPAAGAAEGAGGGGTWDGKRGAFRRGPPATTPADIQGGVIRFPAGRKSIPRSRIVWVLAAPGKAEPRVVRVGISDGSFTEVVDGQLKAGEPVVIGRNVGPESAQAQGRSPFGSAMGPMGPRGGRPGR